MDKAALLISGYCDHDLSDDEQRWLAEWLQQDRGHVDRLVREFRLHSRLYDLLKQQQLQSNAWSHTLEGSPQGRQLRDPTATPSATLRQWLLWMTALAASVAVAAALLIGPWRAAVVAQVSSARGAAVMSDGKKVLAGALLPVDERLRVDRGDVIVTFECGARVRVEAPAVFVVDGKTSGTLARGTAAARVPTQAIGFAIRTPLANITDLGTDFRVQMVDEDRLDLHVFDGLVEVRLGERFDRQDHAPLRISEGRAIRCDAAAGDVSNLQYDESLKPDF